MGGAVYPLILLRMFFVCHDLKTPLFAHCTDVLMRYQSYGWHTQTVDDVNDLQAVRAAILAAKAETGKPSIIKVHTLRFLSLLVR